MIIGSNDQRPRYTAGNGRNTNTPGAVTRYGRYTLCAQPPCACASFLGRTERVSNRRDSPLAVGDLTVWTITEERNDQSD